MAFPQVVLTNTTNGTTATTSAVVNLPTGAALGRLYVMLHRCAVAGAHGYPADWGVLTNSSIDASDDQQSTAYKWSDGTEGATITVTQGSGKFANLCYLISDCSDPALWPPTIAQTQGTTATPDPNSHAPFGGTPPARDYLWLWIGGWEGEQTSPPAGNPTNYTDPIGADSGTAGIATTNCRVASARREINGFSENPPNWTISASDDWTAGSIAITPILDALGEWSGPIFRPRKGYF